jgi:hypothetical protein
MHVEVEEVQRLLHGELEGPRRIALERHLAGCAECREQVEEARREEEWVFTRLARLDTVAPAVDPARLARRGRSLVWGRRAAVVLLTLAGAGAAYAMPGSPLPGWMKRVAAWVAGSAAPPRALPATAGIAVSPGDRLSIEFATNQAEGSAATVWLTDGPAVVARALNGTATFTTDVDRLVIGNHGSTANYEIELPRTAKWVEIRVGQRRLLLKQGALVVTEAPADDQGRYLVSLGPLLH